MKWGRRWKLQGIVRVRCGETVVIVWRVGGEAMVTVGCCKCAVGEVMVTLGHCEGVVDRGDGHFRALCGCGRRCDDHWTGL